MLSDARVTDCTQIAVGFLSLYTVHTYAHACTNVHALFKADSHAQFWTCIMRARIHVQPSLQVISWLVLRLCGGKVILQEALQVLESGPLLWLFSPAGQHQLMQGFWAVRWAWHPVATLHLVQHLPIHHTWEGNESYYASHTLTVCLKLDC